VIKTLRGSQILRIQDRLKDPSRSHHGRESSLKWTPHLMKLDR
jgi:hypothetical protein